MDKIVDLSDLAQVIYEPGTMLGTYKYKAFIPAEIWNKYRPDKPLKRAAYKTVNFGRPGYQQYRDAIGDWSEFDHGDEHRRENYRKRHEPIEIQIGDKKIPSYLVPFTNEFFSYWLMW